MSCNCGKRRVVTKPKKVLKSPPKKPDDSGGVNSTNAVKRIIRRAAR